MLPTIVPIPMSVCPFLIAITDVISSGSEVPMAIMVIPITVSDIPRFSAINTALSTVRKPPKYRSAAPTTISAIALGTGVFVAAESSVASFLSFLPLTTYKP
uniref:Uncharacterized protein n=1 Tax=uncultured marine thaumarchaeote SAT1000_09_A04 TaxID=1456366 RepID=A0A075I8F2_9ARCH|nr:hypothetical protein [uncultured marine thaumarchaeote SAT1000_09_A04]